MTAIQMGALNAEILRNLGAIAEDADLLTRVAKYLRKLVAQKKDPDSFHRRGILCSYRKVQKTARQAICKRRRT